MPQAKQVKIVNFFLIFATNIRKYHPSETFNKGVLTSIKTLNILNNA